MDLEFLKPSKRLRVMDLVANVGIDVSDWKNFKGGVVRAASNPKYCYEWSYEDSDKKLVALNLWYEDIEVLNGEIVQRLNLRETANNVASSPQVRRAKKMDALLGDLSSLNRPARVIICHSERNRETDTKSITDSRLLDDVSWYVHNYNSQTGECLLVRGKPAEHYIDQFTVKRLRSEVVAKKEVVTTVYERSSLVRNNVLARAKGCCEWCGEHGFKTSSGSIYLESHHIQPLSEEGGDTEDNVIALCPNHHREAHFGENSEEFKKLLLNKVSSLRRPVELTQRQQV